MAEFELAGHEMETPLINAPGSVNGSKDELLRGVQVLSTTAIGAIMLGSFTIKERFGNVSQYGAPVYRHDKLTGKTYNAMGLPNVGLETAIHLMPELVDIAHDAGKPVFASVSPVEATPETGNTFSQIVRLVDGLQRAKADRIVVNTSCPNIVTADGGRKPLLGHDPEAMGELIYRLTGLVGINNEKIGITLPPYITLQQLEIVPKLAKLLNEQHVYSFLTTANAIGGQIPRNSAGKPILSVPGGVGGLSGPATKYIGREQLTMWRELLDKDIDIVSTLGIDSGRELAVRRELGAAAAGGVTFLWESQDWRKTIHEIINEFAESYEAA